MADDHSGELPAFRVVIPARYGATRFPGKALADLCGKPVIRHVWEKAIASGASEVLVATDDERIARRTRDFGAEVVMTSDTHRSGTDRAAEVARLRGWADEALVVNCQGDVPLIAPESIALTARILLLHPDAQISTLCTPITAEDDYRSPNVVKVVFDASGRALYFSRAPIPFAGHGATTVLPRSWRHIGLYGYRVGALRRLASTPACELELSENLEQLRAQWIGLEIRIAAVEVGQGPDIDTPADLERATVYMRSQVRS